MQADNVSLSNSAFEAINYYKKSREMLPEDAVLMPLDLMLCPTVLKLEGDGKIITTIASLIGASGCLPPFYEESALKQVSNRNHAYTDFLSLFHRNLADLLISATVKYKSHQHTYKQCDNPFLNTILALAGSKCDEENPIKKDTSIQFATLFATNNRNAASLKAILEEKFSIPITIKEFQVHKQFINHEEQSPLNGSYRLGMDVTIGQYTKHAASHFRLILGPLNYPHFLKFLPKTQDFALLVALTQHYCGFGLTFDIQLVLKQGETPKAKLNGKQKLGQGMWLHNKQSCQDHDEAIFKSEVISHTISKDMFYAA